MAKMANNYTIILPLDRRKTKRLVMLLEMFKENARMPYKEIEKVMPRATFRQILYTLSLIGRYVQNKYGFKLFEFKWVKRENGRQVKVMESITKMEFVDIEGTMFVTFTKQVKEE